MAQGTFQLINLIRWVRPLMPEMRRRTEVLRPENRTSRWCMISLSIYCKVYTFIPRTQKCLSSERQKEIHHPKGLHMGRLDLSSYFSLNGQDGSSTHCNRLILVPEAR